MYPCKGGVRNDVSSLIEFSQHTGIVDVLVMPEVRWPSGRALTPEREVRGSILTQVSVLCS